jgi:hypothetical protein
MVLVYHSNIDENREKENRKRENGKRKEVFTLSPVGAT